MRRSRKPLSVCADPGFESLSLRQWLYIPLKLLSALLLKGFCYNFCYNTCYKQGEAEGMKHVQHVRGKWVARVTVPDELRDIIGKRELVEELPGDAKSRERQAHAVLNRFFATIDDAREVLSANRPTLSTAAKAHYRAELETDDKERAVALAGLPSGAMAPARSIYATRLRLAAAGHMDKEEPMEINT